MSRDLVGRELGIRFEAFTQGPDSGMDGRHATGGNNTILQAKHYVGSRSADLNRTMKRERAAIDRLAPQRYILSTSCRITPKNKSILAAIVGPALQTEADIVGPGDLNGLLRSHPDIEKSHLKLWLSQTAVLERVLRAAAYRFNSITRQEIEEKVRVYAPNPSFDEARLKLDQHHLLIVSGPPGVGKTTLAEMLAYAHMAEDWDLVAIRSLDDGFADFDETQKQVFYFDDFLGRVALDKSALAKLDSDLARFIKRVQKSSNTRFILTTRAPIFEEAKHHSEHLADERLDISRYLLDVGVYTRRIKARILYNHLLVTGTPQSHINTLIVSGMLPKIVDHRHYNPRLIALMTEGSRIANHDPANYPAAFIAALDNPTQLWDLPFRKHIPTTCRNLLLTLFFCDQFGADIDVLREAFDAFNAELSRHFGTAHNPKDFEESLKILEGGFITIRGREVNFVNPSVRDYLSAYLDDLTLLNLAAKSAKRTEWARRVWQHSQRLGIHKTKDSSEAAALALNFRVVAEAFLSLPVQKRVETRHGFGDTMDGLSNTDRIELLAEWWFASREPRFVELIEALAASPVQGWDSWRDGGDLFGIVSKLRDSDWLGELPNALVTAKRVEDGAIELLESHSYAPEDLTRFLDAEEEWRVGLGERLIEVLYEAIESEFRDVADTVRYMDTESTLEEHVEMLEDLAKRASIPTSVLNEAKDIALRRKYELEDRSSYSASYSSRNVDRGGDSFDDAALSNLFAPLLRDNG
nr:ATP-binding protein [Aminobacter niigataensis]